MSQVLESFQKKKYFSLDNSILSKCYLLHMLKHKNKSLHRL